MSDLTDGQWCDICHQKHYQINPACLEERRRRERGEQPIDYLAAARVLAARRMAVRERRKVSKWGQIIGRFVRR